MMSLKFNEDISDVKNSSNLDQKSGDIPDTSRQSAGNPWRQKDLNSQNSHAIDIQKAHNSLDVNKSLQKKNILQEAKLTKAITIPEEKKTSQNTLLPTMKHLHAPQMHLKETLEYKEKKTAPTIRIFEEVDKTMNKQISLKEQGSSNREAGFTSQNSFTSHKPPQMMIDSSPKIGNQKNVITFPLGFPNPNAVDRHIDIDKCKCPIFKDYRR